VNDLLGLSIGSLAQPLVLATLAALVLLAVLALRAPHLARIGLRNVPRRWLRTTLIVFGLMLATTFVAAALAVDDTITLAVKTVAVFNLGRVDEQVVGGNGTLGRSLALFPAEDGQAVNQALAHDPHVAGIAPALVVPNLLVADATAREVRGGVSGLSLVTDHAGPLGDLRTLAGTPAPVGTLASDQVYLNRTTARFLNASPGDQLYLYSTLWPGHRYAFRVSGIVSGGPLGDAPSVVLALPALQQLVQSPDSINRVYVANAGDGLTGVQYSDEIADRINEAVVGNGLHTQTVKQDGVRFALQAQDIFGRILVLFTLFALAIGLLLIFLIFVLLAAERRAELGMARAIGMRRAHIVRMLLFEGAVYDGFAAVVGLLVGLGLGVAVVAIVGPTLSQLGFPLRITLTRQSVAFAVGIGFVFTLATIFVAAWVVSRMTVSAALRDLPEPPAPRPGLLALVWTAASTGTRGWRSPVAALAAWIALLRGLVVSGLVPLALGVWLLRWGIENFDALAFSLGLSCALVGGVLLVRWLALAVIGVTARSLRPASAPRTMARAHRLADRVSALLVGGGLALYWALPFDALANLGFPRFAGGIQVFFVAGVMMVFGTVWAVAPNLDIALSPLRWVSGRLGRLRHVTRVALIYPAQQRFRTGMGLSLFSLVCFTMVVMACIASSTTTSYDNLPVQAAGYDVAGQPLFTPIGGVDQARSAITHASPATAGQLAGISAATPLPLAIIQPSAQASYWQFYPVAEAQGAFLDGVGLPLVARAPGFASDAAVWQAVRGTPGDVVVDIGGLSPHDASVLGVTQPPRVTLQQFIGPPIASGLPGLSSLESLNGGPADPQSLCASGASAGAQSQPCDASILAAAAGDPSRLVHYTLRLDGVATGPGQMRATTLWATDLRGGPVEKLNVVGLVNNARGQLYGLFGSPASFAPIEAGLPPFGNEYYYFKVRPGADAHAVALAVGSALLDHGFETTVLQDILLDVNGPRVFISRVLVGLVGLTLLVGMAALAVTGSRAVVERRQQIGMLRALGFHRLHVQIIFLLESLLVGVVGSAVGIVLGLILCRNVFAVDFFAQFQSGLVLVVPWHELAIICAAAVAASAVAAVLPAWQAGRVAPADALRYE
jgi:putative ABC transport system permease protein